MVSDYSEITKNKRSLTSQAPRQKTYSLTTFENHINFYLVRDYTKNMRSLTSQAPRQNPHSPTTCAKHINLYLVRDIPKI